MIFMYYSPNMQTMSDSWHEEQRERDKQWFKRQEDQRKEERKKCILNERRKLKFKGELFREFPEMKKNGFSMNSFFSWDFRNYILSLNDISSEIKYNHLVGKHGLGDKFKI